MKKHFLCFLIFLLFFFLSVHIIAENWEIESKDFSQEGDFMIFSNKVVASVDNINVFCDELKLNRKTNIAEAKGKIEIKGDGFFFNLTKLNIDFQNNNFEGSDLFAIIEPNSTIVAEKVKKISKDKYIFQKGYFTGCVQCNPRWKINFKEATYKYDSHIKMQNAIIKVKSIPVLYFPYFYYPVKKDKRKTGLLFPKFGNSTFKGFFIRESFFWAIKDNLDLTIGADYYENFGKGVNGELRYGDASGNSININSVYLKDKDNKNYIIKGDARLNLPLDFSLTANLNLNSNLEFIQNYSESFNYALFRNFYSNIYLKKTYKNLNFSLFVDHTETFFSYSDYTRKTRHLPSLNINLYKTSIIDDFLYFSFDAGGTIAQMFRGDEWLSSPKIYFNPKITLNIKPLPWLVFDMDISRNNILYMKSYDDNRNITDENLYLKQNNIKASLIGPTFFRIYDTNWTGIFSKIKHTIEPSVTYRYQPDYENSRYIVRGEYSDYFLGFYYHQLDFTLTNRIYAKKDEDSTANEIMNFGFSQSYYFNPEKQRLVYKPPSDIDTIRWSESNYFMRLKPTSNFHLSMDATYNQYFNSFRNLSISLNIRDKKDKFNLNYSYSRRKFLTPENIQNAMDFMRGRIGLKPDFLPLELEASVDYNLQEKKLYSMGISTNFSFQCINFIFQFRKIGYRTITDNDYQILFTLGFGNISPTPGTFSETGL